MEQPTRLWNRNYLLLYQGQTISRLGDQFFAIALLFWVKHATGSATLLGLMQMASALPSILLGPIGGTFADRHSRRKILVACDLLNGLMVLSLAFWALRAPEAVPTLLIWLFVTSLFISTTEAFFAPAIAACVPDLVPRDRLAAANALGQLSQQLAVFIGQGVGGVLFRLLGAPVLFLVNGLTYLHAGVSEWFIAVPQTVEKKPPRPREQFQAFKQDTLEGLRYVWRRRGLREMVFLSALLNFFTVPILVLLPFYVEDFLRVTADWYGFLLAAFGIGSLIGYALAGSLRLTPRTRGVAMTLCMLLSAGGYGLLGLVQSPVAALGLAAAGGAVSGFFTVNITTLLQATTPGALRGRLFGLLGTLAASLTPLGMGLSGISADLVGQDIPLIYRSCGAIMVLLCALALMNRDFRGMLSAEPLPPAGPPLDAVAVGAEPSLAEAERR